MTTAKRFATVVAFAILLAVLLIATLRLGNSTAYEQEIMRAELAEHGVVATRALRDATPGQLWLLTHYGQEAYLAGRRYPEAAVTIYLLFGETEELRSILHAYGYQQVLPILWYFLHNESLTFEIRDKINHGLTALKSGLQPEGIPSLAAMQQSLTPAERAWIAINRIRAEGNDFLGRFVIDREGVARQLVFNRVFAVTKDALAGNLLSLERKYQLGEAVTRGDLAWAGVDIALLGLVSTKTLIMLKGGRVATAAGKSVPIATAARSNSASVLFTRTAALTPQLYHSSRAIKYGLAGLGIYLLYRYPTAFHAGIGAVADTIGMSRFLLQLVVWAGIFAIPLWLLSWIMRPMRWVILPVLKRIVTWLEKNEPGKGMARQNQE